MANENQANAQELKDMLAAKDTEVSNTAASFAQIQSSWQSSDPQGESTWYADWRAFLTRYASGTQGARNALSQDELAAKLPLVSLTSIDETFNFHAVLLAVNRNWPGEWQPGDLADMENRLQAAYAALGQPEPSGQPIPQPTPGSDSGLGPSSWEAYVTGAAAKLGFIDPAKVPPGTPGTKDGPPLIPTWLKVGGIGAAALWGAAKIKELLS